MNKKLLLASLFLATNLTFAQQLLSDNFDSYTVGNVGTDLTGNTPGQGDWYTLVPSGGANSNFQFVAESGRGNVFSIESTNQAPVASGNPSNIRIATKIGFDNDMWNTKSAGNNILKIEYEFFTGAATTSKASHRVIASSDTKTIGGFNYVPETRTLNGLAYANPQGGAGVGLYNINLAQGGLILDANTWYKVVFFIDYTTNTINWKIPAKSIDGSYNLAISVTNDAPAEIDFMAASAAGNASSSTIKYDNYVVSAVNTTTLGVNDVVSTKFNVYPNPASDVITIANNESIGIEKVSIIDINGRIVKTQSFANESEIQLNISDLKAGVYIFNVSTKEGTATKKIIKK